MQDVGTGPRHPVEDDEPEGFSRHVDAVADGVGAEQAGVFLGAEYVHQRRRVQLVDMLGVERDTGLLQRRRDPLMHGAEPRDRGEQAEPAATRGGEQDAVGRRHLVGVIAGDIGDDEDAGLARVIERRGNPGAHRPAGQVQRPGSDLRRPPVGLVIAGAVAQTGRGDDDAMGRLGDVTDERNGRIDPVAVHADIGLPSRLAVDREPIDELLGRLARQGLDHRSPADDGDLRPALEAPEASLDAKAGRCVELVRPFVDHGPKAPAKRRQWPGQRRQRRVQRAGGVDQAVDGRRLLGLQPIGAVGRSGAGQDLLAHAPEERLRRAPGGVGGEAPEPILAWKLPCRPQQFLERRFRRVVRHRQIADAAFQPPRPPPLPAAAILGAQQPAAEFRRLAARETGRERRIGGGEHVMAFVEHVTHRQVGVVETAERRLGHHQGVVGDDDLGPSRAPHRLLDEAFVVMAAGRIDAFAAPVGKAEGAGISQKV